VDHDELACQTSGLDKPYYNGLAA